MRNLILVVLLAACGGASSSTPECEAAAEQPHTLKCNVGVDTSCRSRVGNYDCHCLCTGFWECDQVKIVCDPDMGQP